ncbi:hypothetical protein Goshw_030127, partial [Gossypium schwendimanii]|nr:hypothetical protein [Gossypium schwendimanii]
MTTVYGGTQRPTHIIAHGESPTQVLRTRASAFANMAWLMVGLRDPDHFAIQDANEAERGPSSVKSTRQENLKPISYFDNRHARSQV